MRIVRDVKKECDEYLNGEDDDDWDGLLDDMELGDGEEEEVGEDWPEEVRQQIVKEVEGIQHIFEELFKLFSSSIPDCVPMKEIEHLNVISDCVWEALEFESVGEEDLRWSEQSRRDAVLEGGKRQEGREGTGGLIDEVECGAVESVSEKCRNHV